MVTIACSPEEVAEGRLTEAHFQEALEAMDRDGFVVLKDIIAQEHIEILREKLLADVALFTGRKNAPFNFNRGNVQQDPPPFPPYLFRDVLVNDIVISITKAILGPGVRSNFYSGNTAIKSDQRQPPHADVGQIYKEVVVPTFGIVVNVPTVDMSPENGSTEIWPQTHKDPAVWMHAPKIDVPQEAMDRYRATVGEPIQPHVTAGSVLLRDIRMWHAGMPNHTDSPRPMIAMIHWASWFDVGSPLKFPKGTESLFEHPDLRTHAVFVEEPIDYINAPHAYDFHEEESETADV